MKKIIFILSAALVAILSIISIDKYNNSRAPQPPTEIVKQTTQSKDTTKATSKETESAVNTTENSETTEEVTNYSLVKVEYKEANTSVALFNGELISKSAILVDINSKSIVYSKNADEKLSPASTTKLLTAITVLQYLDKDQVITVGDEIYLIGAGSSVANLVVGDKLTVEQLLQGLLISSGNDAAYTLAVNTVRKAVGESVGPSMAVELFVDMMNDNVKKLGLEKTNFTTPDGYDAPNQYSTAKDLSKIAYTAYENKLIKNICRMQSVYVPEKGITWFSTNKLLDPESQYYFDKALGMKTGSTGDAGKCLISAAEDGGKQYISVVLNATEDGRWSDSLSLLKYGLTLE